MIPQNIGGKPALRDPMIPMSMLSVLSYHKDRSMLHTNLGSDKAQLDIQSKEGAPYSTQTNRTIVYE